MVTSWVLPLGLQPPWHTHIPSKISRKGKAKLEKSQ